MNIEEAKKKNKEYIFADHFDTLEELLADCKLWIADEDVSAFCRWFDFKCMEALINKIEEQQAEIQKKDKVIDEMAAILTRYMSTIDNKPYDLSLGVSTRKMTLEEVKEYFYKKVSDNK